MPEPFKFDVGNPVKEPGDMIGGKVVTRWVDSFGDRQYGVAYETSEKKYRTVVISENNLVKADGS